MTDRAVIEGDDVLPEPIRVFVYGDGFASIDGELAMSALGPGALATIARKLLAVGYDGDEELDVPSWRLPLSLVAAGHQGRK